ncbi:glycosyltransferase [Granulosicoccaceae sp. 1_MG-2023]|nr:glycosyltransferase [Granulosicoccaceae sp. 1_MG-2023]
MTKRVCIVNPFQHGGGAEYQISCLIRHLSSSGKFEIFYLARHIVEDMPTPGYRVVKIGKGSTVPRFGYMVDAVPLYKALSELKPDVIYQRVGCAYTGIAAFYAKKHDIPMFWHVAHDTDVTPGNAFYGRNPLRRMLEKRAVEYGLRHASGIITQTASQAALLKANYGRDCDATIANFHPAPQEEIDKSGPLTVVWIANLKPWKRPEAFVRLAQALGDLQDVHFTMVGAPPGGGGDAAWGEALLADIERTPNLTYRGQLSHDEVNALLVRSHLFVNTSEAEGFPNTFIQSWMRGLPVASLSVDPDGILEQKQIGFYANGDEDALAVGVRGLLTDDARRRECAERAQAHAAECHSMKNAARIEALLVSQEHN